MSCSKKVIRSVLSKSAVLLMAFQMYSMATEHPNPWYVYKTGNNTCSEPYTGQIIFMEDSAWVNLMGKTVTSTGGIAISFNGKSNCSVSSTGGRAHITNCNTGVYMHHGSNNWVNELYFENSVNTGVFVDSCLTVKIEGCCSYAANYGFLFSQAHHTVLNYSSARWASVAGVYIQASGTGSGLGEHCHLTKDTLEDNTTGLYVYQAPYLECRNIECNYNDDHGCILFYTWGAVFDYDLASDFNHFNNNGYVGLWVYSNSGSNSFYNCYGTGNLTNLADDGSGDYFNGCYFP